VLHFEERATASSRDWRADARRPDRPHAVTHAVVIGADGAIQRTTGGGGAEERADYRQEHLPWGYKELTIAPDPSAVRSSIRLASTSAPGRLDDDRPAQPDHSFTATCSGPFEG
jgi:hypothetical protein